MGALSSDVHISFSNGGPATNPLTCIAFVCNGPKGIDLAPNPHYSGGNYYYYYQSNYYKFQPAPNSESSMKLSIMADHCLHIVKHFSIWQAQN